MVSAALTLLHKAPVVPVLTIERIEDAVPLARALVAGGLPMLEITLRTPIGFEAMQVVAREVEGAIVAAGTVATAADLDKAAEAGAKLAFAPGLTPALLNAQALPLVPGVATASEIMLAMEHGLDALKFFPAAAGGGPATLRAFAGPFPTIKFCPTGGINAASAPSYLSLPNVVAIGGGWLAPADLVRAGDWAGIQALAAAAAVLAA